MFVSPEEDKGGHEINPKFDELWKGYPKGSPYIDPKTGEPPKGYENQCAIRVAVALNKQGVSLESFDGSGYIRLNGEKIPIRAQEFAEWLDKGLIPGIEKGETYAAKNFFEKVEGRTGIIYVGDYWERSNGARTGDHIDLWNGSRMTDTNTYFRARGYNFFGLLGSDFEEGSQVKFYEIKQ